MALAQRKSLQHLWFLMRGITACSHNKKLVSILLQCDLVFDETLLFPHVTKRQNQGGEKGQAGVSGVCSVLCSSGKAMIAMSHSVGIHPNITSLRSP